jgi:WD40 repeat protein
MGATLKKCVCCNKNKTKEHKFEGNFKCSRNASFNVATSSKNIVNIPLNSLIPEEGIYILNGLNNVLTCKLINKNFILGKILAATIMPDGKTIVLAHLSSGNGAFLTVWDSNTGTFKKEIFLDKNETNIKQIVTLADNRIIVRTSGMILKVVYLEDSTIRNVLGHKKTPITVNVLSNGTIISSGRDYIKTWDSTSYSPLYNYNMPVKVRCMMEFNDLIICGTSSGSLLTLNLNSSIYYYLFTEQHELPITTMTTLNDNLIASGSDDTTISIYDFQNKKFLYFLVGHKFPIRSLITLNNGYLASCDTGDKIIFWK